jgi:hypothetical protein
MNIFEEYAESVDKTGVNKSYKNYEYSCKEYKRIVFDFYFKDEVYLLLYSI